MIERIYEVVDKTSDEVYFTLGIFTSLENVIKELKEWPNDQSISEYGYVDG